MLNRVILIGRTTRDVDFRRTSSGTPVATFTLALDNRFVLKDGKPTTDFINCVAFGKLGELAEKYYKQGIKLVIEGRIQTSKYDKDGTTKYSTNIVVESAEFAESKKAADNKQPAQ